MNDKLFTLLMIVDIILWLMIIGGLIVGFALVVWFTYKQNTENKVYVFE